MNKIIKIVEALSKGSKYQSGEVILDHKDKEDLEIMESLKIVHKMLSEKKEKKVKKIKQNQDSKKPRRNGVAWEANEERELCLYFDKCVAKGIDQRDVVCQLAVTHERTPGAIKSRLQKLDKLPEKFYINSYMKRKYKELLSNK
ncbi:MAG: hypothetical protein ACOC1K_06950 [Nanoarchaeota archaeon]